MALLKRKPKKRSMSFAVPVSCRAECSVAAIAECDPTLPALTVLRPLSALQRRWSFAWADDRHNSFPRHPGNPETGTPNAIDRSQEQLMAGAAAGTIPTVSRSFLMLYWTLVFLIVAMVAAVFGFTGIYVAAASIAKVLFFIFLVLFDQPRGGWAESQTTCLRPIRVSHARGSTWMILERGAPSAAEHGRCATS